MLGHLALPLLALLTSPALTAPAPAINPAALVQIDTADSFNDVNITSPASNHLSKRTTCRAQANPGADTVRIEFGPIIRKTLRVHRGENLVTKCTDLRWELPRGSLGGFEFSIEDGGKRSTVSVPSRTQGPGSTVDISIVRGAVHASSAQNFSLPGTLQSTREEMYRAVNIAELIGKCYLRGDLLPGKYRTYSMFDNFGRGDFFGPCGDPGERTGVTMECGMRGGDGPRATCKYQRENPGLYNY